MSTQMARPKKQRKIEVEVYISNVYRKVHTLAVATGKYCNNYNAEAAVLRHAADALRGHKSRAKERVVIFADALSVGTALSSRHSNGLSALIDSLESLTKCYEKVIIQWVPADCEIPGNETADKLTKHSGTLQQEDLGSTYEVAKTIIKCYLSSKLKKNTTITHKRRHLPPAA
jgi:ribonuclease HI